MLERTNLINSLIRENEYRAYLEIGYGDGINFNEVKCPLKVSVDPIFTPTFKGTSDEFFKKNRRFFDLVFIDGLHLAEQVIKDVDNSLKWLYPNGAILIHDCKPRLEIHQSREKLSRTWNGDVWKAIVELSRKGYNLNLLPVDETGIILLKDGKKTFNVPDGDLTWEWYTKNYMNIFNK